MLLEVDEVLNCVCVCLCICGGMIMSLDRNAPSRTLSTRLQWLIGLLCDRAIPDAKEESGESSRVYPVLNFRTGGTVRRKIDIQKLGAKVARAFRKGQVRVHCLPTGA